MLTHCRHFALHVIARFALGVSLIFFHSTRAQSLPSLGTLRQQAEIQQQWLQARVERVLPQLMRRHGVAMWLVISREYNEDPVFFSLISPTMFAARRRTIYVFFDRGEKDGVERLALGGGSQGGVYTVYRDPEVENRELWGNGQWALLRKLIEERNPASIAVNLSSTHALSDGLSASEWETLQQALGEKWLSRVARAELLPLDYIATRLPEMLPTYRSMMQIAHHLIARAFSSEVIEPGATTSEDVVWWLRQQTHDMGLGTWFQPSVTVQRKGKTRESLLAEKQAIIIARGDVLHVDFGITAMGLNTDTQHMGYVLRNGEKEPPAGIKQALKNANHVQDLLFERLRPGFSGNDILARTLEAMRAEQINGTVYTHPIGDHGHGAGPLIGLWDRQQGVPGRGDVLVLPNTWHAIELAATTAVHEWDGQELWVGQEEEAALDGEGKLSWVLPRQTEYHLIK
ncbi:aminopeptidase P family protein [candidate division KSB1 bacterium]|nr:aminopeptidase P family protein [candidate division KSB1 bacterium]